MANQQSLAIADLTSATLTTGSFWAPLGSTTSLTAATVTADKHFMKSNAAGYGGGMSSAKAALESDTRVLAYEAGRKHKVRVNTISAGPLGSRAAKAIGFIDDMIR